MNKKTLFLIGLLFIFAFQECNIQKPEAIENVAREVIEPPIIPPPGVDFGNLSIWIREPETDQIYITEISNQFISISGQVKYDKTKNLNLTMEICDDVDFVTNAVYKKCFNNIIKIPITLGDSLNKNGDIIINKFSITNYKLPFLPAFVRVKIVQGNNIFYSAPCLKYHLRTQFGYTAQQFKNALLGIVLQADDDIIIEIADPIETGATFLAGESQIFNWANLLLKKSTWADKRIAILIQETLKPSHRSKILTKKISDKLGNIADILDLSQSIARQIGESILLEVVSNEIALEKLEIINNIAVKTKNIELISACDQVQIDIIHFHNNFVEALKYIAINQYLLDNIQNIMTLTQLLQLITDKTQFLDAPIAHSIGGFLWGFEEGLNLGNVATGKIIEVPFVAVHIGEVISSYLKYQTLKQNLTSNEKFEIIEIYRLLIYSKYFAALTASETLEGNLIWEVSDFLTGGKVYRDKEALKQLAIEYKNDFNYFRPPINNVDEKYNIIKTKIQ